jgi:hypothetical protein
MQHRLGFASDRPAQSSELVAAGVLVRLWNPPALHRACPPRPDDFMRVLEALVGTMRTPTVRFFGLPALRPYHSPDLHLVQALMTSVRLDIGCAYASVPGRPDVFIPLRVYEEIGKPGVGSSISVHVKEQNHDGRAQLCAQMPPKRLPPAPTAAMRWMTGGGVSAVAAEVARRAAFNADLVPVWCRGSGWAGSL